jgi:exopolyphosphatase / guanosine-5'-triphosphate,3'-diphosphate pyrophosphatase
MPTASAETTRRSSAPHVANATPFGVVDIGSNSVRLVIFDRLARSPVALFNEKSLCGIGRNMVSTGRLDEDGVSAALTALARFREIAAALGVSRIEAVATAAVRDARNGNEFVARARDALGVQIRVLSGEDEARLAAEGVLAAIPDADGVVGDLGGGSLELSPVGSGKAQSGMTLPFGPLRLMDLCDGKIDRARGIVDAGLEDMPSRDKFKGKTLYAVGGVWRNIARIKMEDAGHPIRILHHYEIPREEALGFASFLATQSRKSLESMAHVTRRRAESIPYGALVMERLIKTLKLDRVVISAFGVREGVLFAKLPADERSEDPLIAACRDLAVRFGRDAELGPALDKWIAPVFADAEANFRRLCRAAAFLSDVGWRNHPDHRAEQAFLDVLNAPFIGIDHPGRAMLALALYHRYGGQGADQVKRVERIERFLSSEDRQRAKLLGTALRAGISIAGPSASLLAEASLKVTSANVILTLPRARQALIGEPVSKRLDELAKALDRQSKIETR